MCELEILRFVAIGFILLVFINIFTSTLASTLTITFDPEFEAEPEPEPTYEYPMVYQNFINRIRIILGLPLWDGVAYS